MLAHIDGPIISPTLSFHAQYTPHINTPPNSSPPKTKQEAETLNRSVAKRKKRLTGSPVAVERSGRAEQEGKRKVYVDVPQRS